MSQQNIDLGSFPNDPNADPIRAAFQKVQNNFNELYTTSLSTGVLQVNPGAGLTTNRIVGNVTIAANIPNITFQTDSSLRVGLGTPSGNSATIFTYATPLVIGLGNSITTVNANFSGNVTVSNLQVSNFVGGSLIPFANVTHDLGSPSHRWKDLWLSGNTITVGTQTISTNANGIVTSGNITVTGNLNAGSVDAVYVAGTLTTANQPTITSVGNLTGLTVTGNISSGNLNITGNLSAETLSANVMSVAVMQATTIVGNVVTPPGGNTQAPGADTQLLFNSGGNTAAATGVTFNQSTGLLSITGDVSGGNLNSSGGLVVADTANVGNLKTAGDVFANTGNVQSNNVISLGIISASQSITGGSLVSQGILTVTGDATMGNITTVNSITGNVMILNGNVGGTALVANGILRVTGLANLGGGLITSSSVTASTLTVNNAISANSLTVSTSLTANVYVANVGVSTANLTANGTVALSGNANLTGANTNITGFLRMADANTANVNASGILSVFGSASSSVVFNNGNMTSTGTAFSAHADVSGNVYANSGSMFAIDHNLTGNLYANAGNIYSTIANISSHIIGGGNVYANAGTVFGQHANVTGNVYANSGTLFSNHANVAGNVYANGGTVYGQHSSVSGNMYANSGTLFSQHASVSGNVYANSGAVVANTLTSLTNLTSNLHLTSTNGNIYANNGTTFSNHANVAGNVYANTGSVFANIMQSLNSITAATHVIANSNIYANSGTMFGQHANVTGNVYANGGTIFSNIANIAGNIIGNANLYISNGTLFSNTASLTGNVYANTGTIYSLHSNISGNVYANGTMFGAQANVSGNINANGFVYANHANISGNILANGNITGTTLVGSLFSGNGSALTNLAAANIVGTVGVATNIAGATQGNITSLPNVSSFGIKISLDTTAGNLVAANVNGNHYGNGYTLTSINAANITGTVSVATTAGTANSVAWANVSGKPSNLSQFTNDLSNTAIIASLGFTPYNSTNPSLFISGINSAMVTTALGFTPISSTGTITGAAGSLTGYTLQTTLGTSSSTRFGSLGVGTAASGTTGEIRATDNVTAYYSDDRLKTKLGTIDNALDMIDQLTGFYYEENELAMSLGYTKKRQVGLSAQTMQKVMPEIVTKAPIDPEKYLTIWYEKTAPLLVEGIKELRRELKALRTDVLEIKTELGRK